MLSAYTSCPRQYKHSYIDRLRGGAPQGALIMGSIAHKAIERGEQEELWKYGPDVVGNLVPFSQLRGSYAFVHPRSGVLLRYAQEKMLEAIEECGGPDKIRWAGRKTKEFPGGEDGWWWWNQMSIYLRRWAHMREIDVRHGLYFEDEHGIEKVLTIDLGGGLSLRATMDALMYRAQPSGLLLVRDYKFGQRNKSDARQGVIYGYAVGRVFEEIPEFEFAYLRGNTRDDQLVPVNIEPLVGEVEEWLRWLSVAASSGVFPAFPSWKCKACFHLDICPVGQHYVASEKSVPR